ncbi:hypothetical protein HPP92_023027 [Vanilla planifolia]|uniref:pectinesterase n=1 Tax=Vanilla planifolia TaxID=51239 RepID=A0A835UE68_VANPL|nr:hypothetical protein HPP92_023027 [Vanilla planifolia]
MAILLLSFLLILASVQLAVAFTPVVKTVIVDLHGGGEFRSIQKAINTIPDGNQNWTKIHIKAGIYSEKVNLTYNKGRIVFEGEGAMQTIIQWGDYCNADTPEEQMVEMETPQTPTFTSAATDVVFKWITFQNNYADVKNPKIAVAMLVSGDKTSFYGCSFVGIQDTLADMQGRHYFKDCSIVGGVDFIFGYGQSLYETCSIDVVSGLPVPGWVTAQGRYEAGQPNGFVFKNCRLSGSSLVFLGRAWRSYSRVVFYNTSMAGIVVPPGWDSWLTPDNGNNTQYGEAGCNGAGANTAGRVPWERKLNSKYLRRITSISFIDNEGWLNDQGH